jgi:hypothetical protein
MDDLPEGADGVLGSDILLNKEIVLNFRNGYICYPEKNVFEIAQSGSWLTVPAIYQKGRVFTQVKLGTENLKEMHFLDPASPQSAVLASTQVADTNTTRSIASTSDKNKTMTQENILSNTVLSIGPFKSANQSFPSTTKRAEARIGADVLNQSIIGLDAESKFFWIN